MTQVAEGYDETQPHLEAVIEAAESTRGNSGEIEWRADGAYREVASFWKIDSVDSIGTKGVLHWEAGSYGAAAIDAFAMNFNDLLRDGAKPYKLNCEISLPADNAAAFAAALVALKQLCDKHGIDIGHGETAVLNTNGGMDVPMVMTGRIDETPRPNVYRPGDMLIGIPSSGIHSNGLTDARRLFGAERPPELTIPTRVYGEAAKALAVLEMHGRTHVTGSGLTKLTQPGVDFHLGGLEVLQPQPIFRELFARWSAEAGDAVVADEKMWRKFNNGIGFVLGVTRGQVDGIATLLPDCRVIGAVSEGSGRVHIASGYTGRAVTL